jgi:hypothetical protein
VPQDECFCKTDYPGVQALFNFKARKNFSERVLVENFALTLPEPVSIFSTAVSVAVIRLG